MKSTLLFFPLTKIVFCSLLYILLKSAHTLYSTLSEFQIPLRDMTSEGGKGEARSITRRPCRVTPAFYVIQYFSLWCNSFLGDTILFFVMQYFSWWYNTFLCDTILFSVIQYFSRWYNTFLCDTILFSVIQYCLYVPSHPLVPSC